MQENIEDLKSNSNEVWQRLISDDQRLNKLESSIDKLDAELMADTKIVQIDQLMMADVELMADAKLMADAEIMVNAETMVDAELMADTKVVQIII